MEAILPPYTPSIQGMKAGHRKLSSNITDCCSKMSLFI